EAEADLLKEPAAERGLKGGGQRGERERHAAPCRGKEEDTLATQPFEEPGQECAADDRREIQQDPEPADDPHAFIGEVDHALLPEHVRGNRREERRAGERANEPENGCAMYRSES